MSRSRIMLTVGIVLAVTSSATTMFGRQPSAAPMQAIGDLLVGTWSGEGVYATDYPGVGKKGEKFTSTDTCRWAAGKSAIVCEGKNGTGGTGLGLYYWDAATKQIRTVGVAAAGSADQGTVTKQGDKLVWASAGSLADGRKVEYKGETLIRDGGNTRIEVGATILGGVRNEFRDTYKKARK